MLRCRGLMADATKPAAAPAGAPSGSAPAVDGAAPARPLPTPEELLATFETLAAEHRIESQRISNLTAQLKGTAQPIPIFAYFAFYSVHRLLNAIRCAQTIPTLSLRNPNPNCSV